MPADAQLSRLLGSRDGEAASARGQRRPRGRYRSVPVAVALDDRAQTRLADQSPLQQCDVALDRSQVDAGQRAQRHGRL